MKQAAKSSTPSRGGEYVDLSHVIGTSDAVERLFSTCKLVMTDRRRGMGPEMLDMIMMLKAQSGPLERRQRR